MNAPVMIAIDGTAASGKGTLGKSLAMKLQLDYLDTGKLYRAVAYELLVKEAETDTGSLSATEIADIAAHLHLPLTNEEALHGAEIADKASQIAALPEVRAALLQKQRDFAATPPSGKGAILDGRDIGTVVLPYAPIKIYVDADPEVRATRRHLEMQARGSSPAYGEVLSDIINRDMRDKNRTVAPLIAAEDAFLIDSSARSAQEVLHIALDHIQNAM